MASPYRHILGFIVFSVLQVQAMATNIDWVGSAVQDMNDPNNWSTTTVPTTGDTAQFAITGFTAPFLDANVSGSTFQTDTFSFLDATSYTYAIKNGYSFTLSGGGIVNPFTGLQTFNVSSPTILNPNTLNFTNASSLGNAVFNLLDSHSTLVLNTTGSAASASVNLTSHGSLDVNQSNTVGLITSDSTSPINYTAAGITLTTGALGGSQTISGIIDQTSGGSNIFAKTGTGTVVLANTGNNYSGGTIISNGTLSVSANTNLGAAAGGITFNSSGGTLLVTQNMTSTRGITLTSNGTVDVGSKTVTLSGIISGNGVLTSQGSGGILVLSGANTYNGGTVVNSGNTLSVAADGNLGAAATAITLSGTLRLTAAVTSARPIALTNGTINTQTGTSSFSGQVTGSGLTKSGTGQLNLTGTGSNYGGANNVTAGILALGFDVTNLPVSSSVALSSGTTILFNQSTSGTYVGNITGTGGNVTVAVGALNSLSLTGLTGTVYTGTTTITSGTLIFNNAGNLSLTGPISNSGVADFEQPASTTGTYSGTFTGAGSVVVNSGAGTGTVVLNKAQYTGTTTIDGGTLQFNNAVANTLSSVISINNSAATLDFEQAASTTGTYSGLVSGTGMVAVNAIAGKTGTVLLTGGATYTGATVVNNGSLQFRNSVANTLPSAISILTGATVDFDQAAATVGTYSGLISGAGGVVVNSVAGNTGTVSLTGGATYTGSTTINRGTLQFTNTAANNLPSAISVLTTATLDLEQSASTTGTYSGLISGAGNVVVNATAGNTGTVLFSGGATYTGSTTINRGTLQISNTSANTLPSAISILTGATADFEQAASTTGTYSGLISGAGAVVVNSVSGNTGTVSFTGGATYTGPTTINRGTLQFNNSAANTLTSTISLANSLATVDFEQAAATTGTYSGLVSGSGGVIVNAISGRTGTVLLTGGATYTGSTVVNQGTLEFNNSLANTLPSAITILSGATVDFDQAAATVGTYSGLVSGAGGVIVNSLVGNTGTVSLTGGATYTGSTTINRGTLQFVNSAANTLPSAISILAAATLDLEQSTSTTGVYSGLISGAGNVIVNATAGNTGTVVLSGGTSYTGSTTVNRGLLEFFNNSNTTVPTAIAISSGAKVDFEQGAGTTGTFSGAITGAGSALINNAGNTGKVIFSNILNSYTGGTQIFGGILQGTTATIPSTGGIFLAAAGTVDFEQAAATTGTYSGVISGSGNVLINSVVGDTGRVIFTGANTYSGSTTIKIGVLEFANSSSSSLTGPMVISTGATVDFEQAALTTGTYSGNISGGGAVVVNNTVGNTGTVALLGTNSYSGGTTVSNGTLTGNTTSLQGNITDNATVTFNQNTNATFNGQFFGIGNINVNGSGKLQFATNSSSFAGNTFVNGSLALNSILGGNVFVASSGTLSGIGTILGNLTVNGVVSPGNGSIGTLTVGGNYLQNSGSTYVVQVTIGNQSSRINVGGTATLANNTNLLIEPLGNGEVDIDIPYTILHADAGLTGTFTNVNAINPLIVPTVTYDAMNAYLTFTVNTQEAQTSNQRQVAQQLASIKMPTPLQEAILEELVSLSPDQFRRALDQMSGQQYVNTILAAEFINRQFIRRLYDPLRSILVTNPYSQPCCCCCDVGYGTFDPWISISNAQLSVNGNRNAKGFRLSDNEVSVGAQGTFWDLWTIGTAVSFGKNQVKYSIGGGSRNHVALGAVYWLFRPKPFYFLGDVVLGRSANKITRRINVGAIHLKARSTMKISQGTMYFELGRDYSCEVMLLQPFVGLELGHYRYNGLSEKCAQPLNLELGKKSQSLAYTRVGVHLTSSPIPCGLSMAIDIAWQYRLNDFDNGINVRFLEFGDTFAVKGYDLEHNCIEGAISLTQEMDCGWEIFGEIGGEYWGRAGSYSLLLGLKAEW